MRCIMDTSALDISFDEFGHCNYCTDYLNRSKEYFNESSDAKNAKLKSFVERVRADGKGKKYDCIIGVSGGVDSSWVLVRAVELGLRPLAIHIDNGWNTSLSESNVRNLVEILGVDLHVKKIDSKEYNALLQAFLDADVIDIELVFDNAMLAFNYQQAERFGVKYILSGSNTATEGLAIPKKWNWFKYDKKNIYALAKKFGNIKIETIPTFGILDYFKYEIKNGIRWVSFLDLMPYNKFDVLEQLEKNFNYIPYPYKHYESILTRFYQAYILPKKFGVDKRLVHLSTLVVSGQMTYEDANESIRGIAYPSEREQEADIQEFLFRMDWTRSDLDSYIARPAIPHDYYGSNRKLWDFIYSLSRMAPKKIIKNILVRI